MSLFLVRSYVTNVLYFVNLYTYVRKILDVTLLACGSPNTQARIERNHPVTITLQKYLHARATNVYR